MNEPSLPWSFLLALPISSKCRRGMFFCSFHRNVITPYYIPNLPFPATQSHSTRFHVRSSAVIFKHQTTIARCLSVDQTASSRDTWLVLLARTYIYCARSAFLPFVDILFFDPKRNSLWGMCAPSLLPKSHSSFSTAGACLCWLCQNRYTEDACPVFADYEQQLFPSLQSFSPEALREFDLI